MSILRSLDHCTISFANPCYPKAVHIVVGFICQLCRMASSTFDQIFDEIRSCCSVKRDSIETHRLMFTITDHLGEMCKEIRAFDEKLHMTDHSVCIVHHQIVHTILIFT